MYPMNATCAAEAFGRWSQPLSAVFRRAEVYTLGIIAIMSSASAVGDTCFSGFLDSIAFMASSLFTLCIPFPPFRLEPGPFRQKQRKRQWGQFLLSLFRSGCFARIVLISHLHFIPCFLFRLQYTKRV
jgi:hypothetical protein